MSGGETAERLDIEAGVVGFPKTLAILFEFRGEQFELRRRSVGLSHRQMNARQGAHQIFLTVFEDVVAAALAF